MAYQSVQQATTLWDVLAPQLPQKAETPLRLVARALDLKVAEAESLLKSPVSAESLLNLNRIAQYRHLALTNRVWPVVANKLSRRDSIQFSVSHLSIGKDVYGLVHHPRRAHVALGWGKEMLSRQTEPYSP